MSTEWQHIKQKAKKIFIQPKVSFLEVFQNGPPKNKVLFLHYHILIKKIFLEKEKLRSKDQRSSIFRNCFC